MRRKLTTCLAAMVLGAHPTTPGRAQAQSSCPVLPRDHTPYERPKAGSPPHSVHRHAYVLITLIVDSPMYMEPESIDCDIHKKMLLKISPADTVMYAPRRSMDEPRCRAFVVCDTVMLTEKHRKVDETNEIVVLINTGHAWPQSFSHADPAENHCDYSDSPFLWKVCRDEALSQFERTIGQYDFRLAIGPWHVANGSR